MIKKIAITLILLSLFIAGSMIAEDPPERYTLDIYVTVYCITTADVDVGYKTIEGVPCSVQNYPVVNNGTVIHRQIEVWPGDPPPDKVFAEGWDNVWYAHDYDEDNANFSDPMYLELWIGVGYIDPTIPPEE